MLRPCRSSQDHDTALPSRDGLWATCPRSASSGYHSEFHEDCHQKHIIPPHNDPYLRLKRVVVAHYKIDDLLNCWTSSSDISSYHTDFHEGHGTVGAGQGRGMACCCCCSISPVFSLCLCNCSLSTLYVMSLWIWKHVKGIFACCSSVVSTSHVHGWGKPSNVSLSVMVCELWVEIHIDDLMNMEH